MDDLLSALVNKREKGFKVALIAAFTESPGDFSHSDSIKNLRIGYPLYSGFDIYKDFNKKIYWLMDPKKDYVPFWVGGESNRLENCASIYGCQGFETDYAGFKVIRGYLSKMKIKDDKLESFKKYVNEMIVKLENQNIFKK